MKSNFDFKIIIHNKYDLPQSGSIHPIIYVDKDWMSSQKVFIRNKKVSKHSTKSRPCQKFWQKSCEEIKRQDQIAMQYNCHVPFFYTGEHLTKVTKIIEMKTVD